MATNLVTLIMQNLTPDLIGRIASALLWVELISASR